MKLHHAQFGQKILTPAGLGKIVAVIVAPRETVMVSADGLCPGARLDPEQWQVAEWDARRAQWVVPAAP